MPKKTDNGHLFAKLDLRRYFLRKYHADGAARVMDCCAGSGRLWNTLRREFVVSSYWAMDVKPKPGRLKIDSSRVLAQSGWAENVIDVDTYGSPWKHWEGIAANIAHPVTVFLTIGQLTTGTVGSLGHLPLEYMGLKKFARTLPAGFHVKLRSHVVRYAMKRATDNGVRIVEAIEAEAVGNARYIGVRLEPPIASAA